MGQKIRVWVMALLAAALVSACQPDAEGEVPAGTFDPGLAERQQSLCEAEGGRWGAGGSAGSFVCYTTPPDANQPCASDNDCEGLCLARSRTCAPAIPFFGCHDILNSLGAQQTLCIN